LNVWLECGIDAGMRIQQVAMLALLVAGGCAAPTTLHPTVTVARAEITFHPWHHPVKLVRKTPSRTQYQYVGPVRGVSSSSDDEFVEAAHTAQDRLQSQARALGADVVKIVAVTPGKHRVMLAGRAYRAIE
jgi:hypothetical protein